ncbi:hypothetical protein DFA_11158 [Cavenderia fasciculata]|uniref:Paramecium surface antigen repeat-containing protein n=1 Tax=Cavenderia fasciculata TaxID=261658 RepID=F4QF38_CACFS|nr:uncharacterized protein DFA_11158 [Cavenderia fasciculata]EGG13397.1 hypothetical protein DFA_11158 [Cavenderia fasciculata]|eukprot:XP_004350101.1 hypothetical protein DFA_11158 [Cavenderia fasciculata]
MLLARMKVIITFLLLLVLLISTCSSQTCNKCLTEGQDCTKPNTLCQLGLYCGLNPKNKPKPSSPSSPSSESSDGSSTEPIPLNVCKKQSGLGEVCDADNGCIDGADCYPSARNESQKTCQTLKYLQYGEKCKRDNQCLDGLECEPIKDVCMPLLLGSEVEAGIECTKQEHCPWDQFCNKQKCYNRVGLGEKCSRYFDDIDAPLTNPQCILGLLCDPSDANNITNSLVCVKMGSKGLGQACNYTSPAGSCNSRQGYYCNMATHVCEVIAPATNSSVICSPGTETSGCNDRFEKCECTATGSSTGVCKDSLYYYNQPKMTKCMESYIDIIDCSIRTKTYLSNRQHVPGSKLSRECPTLYCKYQDACFRFEDPSRCNPKDTPFNGLNYGMCGIRGAGSITSSTGSLSHYPQIYIIFIFTIATTLLLSLFI